MLADWRLLPMVWSILQQCYLLAMSLNFSLEVPMMPLHQGLKKAGRIKLGGKLSLALLDLKHLPYLELSNNDFDPTQTPNWFRA
ncbi:hypothetical protein Godav_002249 [Gossypium davidsonii]|uniref:Uncharacterized protein n=1 Tax=Gossypium davidsonii TaxID=34287 RepID=A0A7J8SX65_GOSDV|nr:hypothetical protein [Gossypium davidsonii]